MNNINETELHILNKCFENEILKNNLTQEQLLEIEKVLREYINFSSKYNNEGIDTGEAYINKYGNSNIVDWFEGLKSTKDFIKDFKLESTNYIK